MITYVVCDLFTSPARTLVNTVNTVGVMGKGIAKDFKSIYPEMFTRYQELCEKGQFDVGQLWLYRTPHKWVLNFPTKKHWRSPSHPDYIEAGLRKFADTYHIHRITDISFPLLGCGNGELDWESQVRPLMERYLGKLPIEVYVHLQDRQDPYAPEHLNLRQMKQWLRGEPESLAFNEVWTDLITAVAAAPHSRGNGSGERFRAGVGNAGESIILELADETVTISAEIFLDLWQQLRAAGFLAGDYFPNGLNAYSTGIIPLLAKLPYVQPVEMVKQSEQGRRPMVGLRIMPGNAEGKQSEPPLLLSGVGVVEPE